MLNVRFHMEINRIKLFCTIAETGNMRRAAEFHRMSPGALSKSMKQLEIELGTRVFANVGRGIVLTDAGHRLYASSERLLHEYGLLKQAVRDADRTPQQRELRVGSFELFTTYCLAWIGEQFMADRLTLCRELTPGAIEAAVLDRAIDIGLTCVPMPNPELDHLAVGEFESGIFLRAGAFPRKCFEELPFAVPITPIGRSPANIQSLDGWPSDRFPRLVKYRFELLETALQFSSRGLAAIYCPKFIVKFHNERVVPKYQLSPHSLPKGMSSVSQTVYLVMRKSDQETAEIKTLSKALRLALKN